MANIRVICPTCGKQLEVGAEHAGKEVECGECFQVFVAKEPEKLKIKVGPSHGPPPGLKGKPKRRREDDDDDYDHDRDDDDYQPTRSREASTGGTSGTAVVGVVVGVVALVTSCCPFTGIAFGILAIVLGSMGKNAPNSSGAGTAAIVLGTIAFLISGGLLAFWFVAGGANLFGN